MKNFLKKFFGKDTPETEKTNPDQRNSSQSEDAIFKNPPQRTGRDTEEVEGNDNTEKSANPQTNTSAYHQINPATKEMTTFRFLNNDYDVTEKWTALFAHFIQLNVHNLMPYKEWYDNLQPLIDDIGKENFIATGTQWIKDCIEKSKENQKRYQRLGIAAANKNIEGTVKDRQTPEWVKKVYGEDLNGSFFKLKEYVYLNNFQNYFYHSLGGRILRGFLQSTVILQDDRLIELVDKFAATNPNESQDAIHIYTKLPKDVAVPKLTFLKSRVKNKNVLSRVNKAIKEIGKRSGLSAAEVEESVIPTFGLDGEGKMVQIIGDYSAVYQCENFKTFNTFYLNENGKQQKALPKTLKDNFPGEVKIFKRTCKEIKDSLAAQRRRLETFYYTDREIDFDSWMKNYIDHPLVKIIAKDLIWNFQNAQQNTNGIWNGDGFIDVAGNPISSLGSDIKVRLWHPIGFAAEYILAWRNYLLQTEKLQAFKQAFREVYIITDAELNTQTYSNRFASHILNKDHVSALCKARGWSASGIINYGRAKINIPNTDYSAEYWVQDVNLGEHSKIYGSAHLTTDQVRFYKKKSQLELAEVPALIFSEVMRDVDLFVGVTSIGNDPNWQNRGQGNAADYWQTYSFGDLSESAQTRSEILKNIIPKMKIGKQCSFDGRYLCVQGKIRKYKIHMGSGNILMEPNDQYLCIVADRREPVSMKKMFIPFEGDNMLSIIISKALLLANDTAIDDPSIVRQIEQK